MIERGLFLFYASFVLFLDIKRFVEPELFDYFCEYGKEDNLGPPPCGCGAFPSSAQNKANGSA